MATPPLRQQVLALAALMQSVYLADSIARTGNVEPESLEACLHSLFVFSAEDGETAYGGVKSLELGLRCLCDALSNSANTTDKRNLVRYSLGIMHLHKQLLKAPDKAAIIRSRLEHTEKQISFNNNNINGLASSIAAIYKDTLSQLRYRIKISGSMQQLENPVNADRIRALLLAGVRAVYLWRQAGGTRWQLLFGRNRILQEARQILDGELPR